MSVSILQHHLLPQLLLPCPFQQMGFADEAVFRTAQKRKMSVEFPLNDLNQDLLERILACLPTASFLRLQAVCKRWKSAAGSTAFRLACSQVPRRDPWFFMVDCHPDLTPLSEATVFDSSEKRWKKLRQRTVANSIPVAASGGLICFHSSDCEFSVINPVTGMSRLIKSPILNSPIQAIAMAPAFNLVVVFGEIPDLAFTEYDSMDDEWEPPIALKRHADEEADREAGDECTPYFLSKSGNVVSTDIQRSPSKQYSSVVTHSDGDRILHFISYGGKVVACNLTRHRFSDYPRLLPTFSEYSIDLVECRRQMYVVLLSDFLETASLRVWRWDDAGRSWHQVARMPPSMSHRFYGQKADINCAGADGQMLVCVSSSDACNYFMCNFANDEWTELPAGPTAEGKSRDFVCAFSFEPRIEALQI